MADWTRRRGIFEKRRMRPRRPRATEWSRRRGGSPPPPPRGMASPRPRPRRPDWARHLRLLRRHSAVRDFCPGPLTIAGMGSSRQTWLRSWQVLDRGNCQRFLQHHLQGPAAVICHRPGRGPPAALLRQHGLASCSCPHRERSDQDVDPASCCRRSASMACRRVSHVVLPRASPDRQEVQRPRHRRICLQAELRALRWTRANPSRPCAPVVVVM